MSWNLINKETLVQKGQEVLRDNENRAWVTQEAAAKVATAYARLAEALGDDSYYGEV